CRKDLPDERVYELTRALFEAASRASRNAANVPGVGPDLLAATPLPLHPGRLLALAMVVLLRYVSTREWQRETNVLLEQREAEALALASTAIARDMKGMWTTVVAPLNVFEVEEEALNDLMRTTARAFARFPYPESFILWKTAAQSGGITLVFNRTE